jgi:GT2 family glycosyltransferase
MFDGTELVSCSSCGVLRKATFEQLGGFDERLGTSADWDLLLRAALRGEIVYVDMPLVIYRVHDSNMSRNIHATESDMRRAFDIAFGGAALPVAIRARRRRAYARLYRMLAGSYREVGDLRSAVRSAFIALRFDPTIAPKMVSAATRRSRPTEPGQP